MPLFGVPDRSSTTATGTAAWTRRWTSTPMGSAGSWPGYRRSPISSQVPPGRTGPSHLPQLRCSQPSPSISITISASFSVPRYGDATTVITVPALGAQTSGTLTFAMPNIGQHLTDGIFVPGVTFLESWGAWPTSDCRLNGRTGERPGLEKLSINSVPPGTCLIGLQNSSASVATGTRQAAPSPVCPLGVTIANLPTSPVRLSGPQPALQGVPGGFCRQ